METLTRSGAGVLVRPRALPHPAFTDELGALLARYRFVLVRGALPEQRDAVGLMSRFGPINNASTRSDGAVVVETRDDDEVFRSSAALPLHKDGLLTGFDITLVGIYCIDFKGITAGRTYVSDANRALERMPPEHVALLRENGIEGMPVDNTGYYKAAHMLWHPAPAFRARPGEPPTLNLGLPHAPGEPESWRVRVAGVSEARSDEVMRSLRAALLDEDYTYFHDWQEGDLLVMDNYAVLHGREAFEGQKRRLANIQVLAETARTGAHQGTG